MKLGFVSAILPELSLAEVFALVAAEGFATVELMCWPPGKAERRFAGVTHLDVGGLTAAGAAEIQALCAQHQVEISALGYYPNILDPELAAGRHCAEHLKLVIAAAAKLGLNTVNTFVGRDWTKSVEDNWPRFLEVWRPLLQFAADHGVRIGIENCPMRYSGDEWPGGKNLATSPVIWRRMFNDIPVANFGLNYDPSHFAVQFMDPISPLREFREKLFHIHAKDISIDQAKLNEVGSFAHPGEWHQPRIPGFGVIDWARFMAALTAVGYNGPVCIEVEDDTFGRDLAGRQRALKVARNVLRPYIA